jgi:3-oxoacyl-[acyl-carrier protein] reductase
MDDLNVTLKNQTVLVTGASRGIGAAIARSIGRNGGRVVVHYRSDEKRARAVLEEIGGRGWIVQADLEDRDGALRLWQAAEKAIGGGHIDALINNAGIRLPARLEDDLATWQNAWHRDFQVNLFAAVDLCRFAIAHFRKHGGGKIVNISSRAGQRGHLAEFMSYGASKAALINLTKSIARDFAHEGIIAVAIAPGFVRTEMAQDYADKYGKDAVVSDIPLKQMAEPEEIAELVTFVLQPSQRSLNGATLDINGGSYMR